MTEEQTVQKVVRQTSTAMVIATAALTHVPLLVGLGVLLAWITPAFAEMYRDMGSTVPAPTQVAFALGAHLRRWWIPWLAASPVLVVADVAVVAVLARRVSQVLAWVWNLGVGVGLTVFGVAIFLAIYVPLFRAIGELS